MAAAFQGFLGREQFHLSLKCGSFAFSARKDLIVADRRDPEVYNRAHLLLRSYQTTHRHAVIALDAHWNGSPGAAAIAEHVGKHMMSSGWNADNIEIVVIDPELETWILQDNIHVDECLRIQGKLKDWLHEGGFWPSEAIKPVRPKKALERALRLTRTPRSSAIYSRITSKVSVLRCQDPAFQSLCQALRQWFPPQSP